MTPILKTISPLLNYLDILKSKYIKPSSDKAISKLLYPEQRCPNCNSDKNYHYNHTKTQKRCKCCSKTFSFNRIYTKNKISSPKFYCPHCSHTLSNRSNRHFSLDFNSLLEHINQSSKTRISFNFKKFNFDVVSKLL